ncbi:PPE family protein [Mycobacterium attenuatum]|uniref:PPE family protein n=1 Tax=Mycobacterium attenuatum TaxID=2341086 RepID=UPI000F021C9B|nr:PPE family protein [Mycobacterium attenuatum]VBA61043.1 putative PPE family protein PPE29 [Mycobacterium attenuatum]
MDFGGLPPEVNSGRLYAGPGPGTMLAAATGWQDLATELHSVASGYESVVSSVTVQSWAGPASMSMAAAAAPYLAWMRATAVGCEQAAAQAAAAVTAYESAFVMTVPPPVIAANRAELAALVATNILGQNTPAIAATEAHYSEMWARDAAAMYAYADSSAAVTSLAPFECPPQTTNPGGLASQAAAMSNAVGGSAGADAQTMTSSLSAVPQVLQAMAAPGPSTGALSSAATGNAATVASSGASAPITALSSLTGISGKGALKGAGNSVDVLEGAATGLTGLSGSQLGLVEDTTGLGMDAVGLVGLDGGGVGLDFFGVGLDYLGADELTQSGGLGPLGAAGVPAITSPAASASLGQASSLGTLSVPPSWAEALSTAPVTPAGAVALPEGQFGAVPAAAHGATVSKLPLGGMVGREADGAVQRVGVRSSVIPRSPMGG